MKILASSDIHNSLPAFRRFAGILAGRDYDCGILAGDLLDDGVTPEELMARLNLTPDDLLEELAPEGETYVQTLERRARELHDPDGNFMKCLRLKEMEVKELLASAGKPIFVIRGNHDLTDWASYRSVTNIHSKKIRFKGYELIGYQFTEFNRTDEQQRRDFRALGRHLNGRTILVTHIPAKGVLDFEPDSYSYGSEPLAGLLRARRIALHIHGHVHGRFGREGRALNVAYPQQRSFVSIDLETKRISLLR